MISHVVQTLTSVNTDVLFQEYVIDITKATTNIQTIIILILRHFGAWGNSLFFVCSAWFLLDSSTYKKKKWFFLLVEIWSVSIIILSVAMILKHGDISFEYILKSLFPTIFATNWYMTCYLLFYPLHPILNGIIGRMNQTQLFRSAGILTVLYILFDFIKGDLFFSSTIILWVTIYFVIAYMKKYMMRYADDARWNVIVFGLGVFGFVGLILFTEFCGLHISFLNDQMVHWASNCNPFLILMSISMFNLARNIHFKNRIINWISSLSMLVYIIHENLLVRSYFRPVMWNYVYTRFGYGHVIRWIFALAAIIFVLGILGAALYTVILRKTIKLFSEKVYSLLRKWYLFIEKKLLAL